MTTRRQTLMLAAAMATLLPGCASRFKADAEAPTYAAKAKIKVKTNRDDLRQMTITVDHLAPPHRINPAYDGYVVWIRVPGRDLVRAGVLDYNEKRRRGKLKATTPHSNFEVLISFETNTSAAAPTDENIVVRQVVGDNGLMARLRS